MATNDNPNAARLSQREAQVALEKQVAQMKRDIERINRTLAEQAEQATGAAAGWLSSANERASRTTQTLREQAQTVSQAVKTNPGTVSSAMIVGGLIGFMLGCLATQMNSGRNQHDWYSW
ncbi:hypothetical protein [Aminobacter sp. MET-1]|uniref:hypothetical protein n=1 Tax=Aminobacter sp. MET-1 TaxID=2951085 RepID=UPI002269E8C6|nr:hypothetical protein [Aminobacter sp. MET-1]MCX8570787.1 hypothetical protein [Aminobacter sp. MET-1]